MANPFQVQVPNALQALMVGERSYEGAQEAAKQRNISAVREEAAREIIQGGNLQNAFGKLMAVDPEGAKIVVTALHNKQTAEHQGATLAETARYHSGSLAQQGATLAETARYHSGSLAQQGASLAEQRRQNDRNYGLAAAQPITIKGPYGDDISAARDTKAPGGYRVLNPTEMPGGTPQVSAGPPVPPGLDPKTYRREMTEEAVKDAGLRQGGQQVLDMVDQLEGKITDPNDPAVAQKFGAATGPFVSAANDASTWDPRKWAYEAAQKRETKAYLDRIKQDAQTINAVMQRNLLKGQGAVSENERAQINEILGKIAASRSPEDAQALLNNFRSVVRKMFKMPEPKRDTNLTGPGKTSEVVGVTQLPNIPPPPAGFTVVK
jgi:hypothetical protein